MQDISSILPSLVPLAHLLADEAGKVILAHYRTGFGVDHKSDDSPVTVADRGVEARLREVLEAARPEDGILGEEYGPKESKSGFTWVIDPIDGTKSFVIGRPTFGTLIALCYEGAPILGLIDQPILKERWIGDGSFTTFNDVRVSTRSCKTLKDARIGSTAPAQLPNCWEDLSTKSNFMIWGGDCYSYGLLANGWMDGVVEDLLAPYDFLALPPIVMGAGGWMGDWEGNPLTISSKGKTLAVGDASFKEEIRELLR
jgi:inositol-phosphate phosphatase/L-galactose 1-phosphate phosphatase/histidinol-phosphatase